jgi:hypothetical protein
VEAGSNTSSVILRVEGGDEKGSLKSETIKYDHESQGTRTRERLPGKGQQHVQNTDPSARQKERPTSTSLQLSDSNKDLVVSSRWVLYSKTDWPTEPSVVT